MLDRHGAPEPVKIATWNVNGIRARQDEVAAFVTREQPDVLCLQEIKATRDHIPRTVGELALTDYWCYWHGTQGLLGRGAARAQGRRGRPADVLASRSSTSRRASPSSASRGCRSRRSTCPNGGKDFAAKVRFLEAMAAYAAGAARDRRRVVLCGDLNVARTEKDVHPSERNDRARRPASRRARAVRTHPRRRRPARRRPRPAIPTTTALFTWWAPWRNMRQRNIGWRLDYVLASGALAARASSCVSMREFGTSDHAPVVATFGDAGASTAAS